MSHDAGIASAVVLVEGGAQVGDEPEDTP
jgi:hypothetical protein